MDCASIQKGLNGFVEPLSSQTFINTYRVQKRASLLGADMGTRANSIWKMAEYIVAPYDDDVGTPFEDYLKGWGELTKKHKNQFLIIGENATDWKMYDSDCNFLGGNDFIEEYLKKKKLLKDKAASRNRYHKSTIKSLVQSPISSYLPALRTKPFMLLAGISGTGKSRIVRKLAQATVPEDLQRTEGYCGTDFTNDRWALHAPANFELIQVKPNWHNSMDVVGYLSNIPSPHYVFTPFVQFVAKAWKNPDVPFFLCLDEMNLAPVEEYFAEFLSAIESRSFEKGANGEPDVYVTDPIIQPFKAFGKEVADEMIDALIPGISASNATQEVTVLREHFLNRGLTLPKNLIVIGTVNMDETTFSFSRKVLDRAMSVEMNDVDYDSFLLGTTDDDIRTIAEEFATDEDGAPFLNRLLVDRHIEAKEVVNEMGPDAEQVIRYLKRINNLLDGTPFKLGYRAANEAIIYLCSCQEFGQPDCRAALDRFTLMKILSRIEGDQNKLKIDAEADSERLAAASIDVEAAMRHGELNILTALRYIINQELATEAEETSVQNDDESANDAAPQTGEPEKAEPLKSIRKIDGMLSQLKRDHFVSYWN